MPAALLTPEETARQLGVSVGTLANWRANDPGHPLKWLKLSGQHGKRGGRVRYRPEDVAAFTERCRA